MKKTNNNLLSKSYTTGRYFEAYDSEESLCLRVKKIPWLHLIILLLFYQIIGLCGFLYLHNTKSEINIKSLLPVFLTIFTGIMVFIVVVGKHYYEQKQGNVFIYNKLKKTVMLPRINLEFPVDDVYIEMVFGWIGNHEDKENVVELCGFRLI